MRHKPLSNGIKNYVEGMFRDRYPKSFQFYNFKSTLKLVDEVDRLSNRAGLSNDEKFILQTAGWFFYAAQLELWKDEQQAAAILPELLTNAGIEISLVDKILNLIPPKYFAHDPQTLCEQLLSDAIRLHWSRGSFISHLETLRQDSQIIEGRTILITDWLKHVVIFMETYNYFTPNHKNRESKIRQNIHCVEKELRKIQNRSKNLHSRYGRNISKMEYGEISDKGVETMFKITSSNNQRLTSLADNKAHILITINSIILSAIISIVLRKIEDDSYLIYPIFILLGISLFSMIFAILATRPNIPGGRFTQYGLNHQSGNLLFFGNIYRLSLAEYMDGMLGMMYDKKLIYNSLLKDIHEQGIVLAKKYLLLRVAYNIFMFGLVISIFASLAVYILYHFKMPSLLNSIQGFDLVIKMIK